MSFNHTNKYNDCVTIKIQGDAFHETRENIWNYKIPIITKKRGCPENRNNLSINIFTGKQILL